MNEGEPYSPIMYAVHIEKYYLSYEEYYSKNIDGIINLITSLEKK